MASSNTTTPAPGSAGQNEAHTPGPWKTDEYAIPERSGSALYIRSDERHWTICAAHETNGCTTPELDISKAEALANARLIAAAPELFDVLAKFLDFADAEYVPNALFARARAAIAKATGEGA